MRFGKYRFVTNNVARSRQFDDLRFPLACHLIDFDNAPVDAEYACRAGAFEKQQMSFGVLIASFGIAQMSKFILMKFIEKRQSPVLTLFTRRKIGLFCFHGNKY